MMSASRSVRHWSTTLAIFHVSIEKTLSHRFICSHVHEELIIERSMALYAFTGRLQHEGAGRVRSRTWLDAPPQGFLQLAQGALFDTGLIKGISSYKPEKNVRLATYAARCIENEILMFFRSQKKLQGEVSLSETLETDKDGNNLFLMDVVGVEDTMLDDLDTRESHIRVRQLVDQCLTERDPGYSGPGRAAPPPG